MIEKVVVPHRFVTYCCEVCMKEAKWVFTPYENEFHWFCSRSCYRKTLKRWLDS